MSDSAPDDRDGPPRGILIAAIVVAVGAIIAILVVAATRATTSAPQPVAIAAAPAPHAGDTACQDLMKVLPDTMGDYHRAAAVAPVPAGAAAWQAGAGTDPVIVRCGLDRPDDFVTSSPLQGVDDVEWFRIPGDGRTTWVAVDRPVYVALTLPDGSGPDPIQLISRALATAMPSAPLDPGPIR